MNNSTLNKQRLDRLNKEEVKAKEATRALRDKKKV